MQSTFMGKKLVLDPTLPVDEVKMNPATLDDLTKNSEYYCREWKESDSDPIHA